VRTVSTAWVAAEVACALLASVLVPVFFSARAGLAAIAKQAAIAQADTNVLLKFIMFLKGWLTG
jgi:hypothetical protein